MAGNVKALAMFSGGLDSVLAAKLIIDQGVEVEGIHFSNVFSQFYGEHDESGGTGVERLAQVLGITLHKDNISEELAELVKHPKHGYGSGMNPCIDCRILSTRRAGVVMERIGAKFVITGEVLGQRPMSQHRKALELIARESGLPGLIVRPLSAQLLEPTVPEKEGMVDRDRLLALRGRSRRTQLSLAEEFGITGYQTPAGGCLLTEAAFSTRLHDLFEHDPKAGLVEMSILRYGRHIRISPTVKIIVGRDEADNHALERYRAGRAVLEATDYPGPVTLAPAGLPDEMKTLAAAITARYGQGRDQPVVQVNCSESGLSETIKTEPVPLAQIKPLII